MISMESIYEPTDNNYTIKEYYKLIESLWKLSSPFDALNIGEVLRLLVDFSLTHSLYLKNEKKRDVELGDLSMLPVHSINALVVQSSDEGGSKQYYGCYRHKYVEFCPHFSIAAYLFCKYHILGEYGSTMGNSDVYLNKIKLFQSSEDPSDYSYSQQQMLSVNESILEGLYGKRFNSYKSFMDKEAENSQNPKSNEMNSLPYQTLLKLSGFRKFENYDIKRDLLEPPQELLHQIFPFLDEVRFEEDVLSTRAKEVLLVLRRSLCQDMVIIKNKYPNNPLSNHYIFNSNIFNNFAKEMELVGLTRNNPTFEENEIDLKHLVEFQDSKLRKLEEQLKYYCEEQREILLNLNDFILRQNEVFQNQSEYLQRIQNSTNGILILLTSRNKNSIELSQQSLSNNSSLLSYMNKANINQGLNNTIALVSKLNQNIQQQQNFFSTNNNYTIYNNTQREEHPDPKRLKRRSALNRRLSRQASTLFEMWDDFKSLEKELKDNGITMTEWLKVHGSSERQFRHTRLKIIRFIEEEAERRKCNVEMIKEKLHKKMRNRLRPWTLDEIQRKLTSGKRINLDGD